MLLIAPYFSFQNVLLSGFSSSNLTYSTTVYKPRQEPPKTAASIVSECIKYYSDALQLKGTIILTVQANELTQVTTTDLEYEKPAKLYIKQVRTGTGAGTWIVVSDGNNFSYPNPIPSNLRLKSVNRLMESVNAGQSNQMSVATILAASSLSLPDFSRPLAIAVSWKEELKRMLKTWLSMKLLPEKTVDGQKVYPITGDYAEYYQPPITGTYEIDINEAGQVVRYQLKQVISVPGDSKDIVNLTQTWDCNFKIDAGVDEKIFNQVKQ